MRRKILKGIKALDKFEIQSCYYTHLMTGYVKFGADSLIVAANYLPIYGFDTEKNKPYIKRCEIFEPTIFRRLAGVQKTNLAEIGHAKSFIVDHINQGHLVILPVDCYDLNYRPDTYQRQHVIHFILIYGYDGEKKLFFANEHNFRNSLNYRKVQLPMETIISAHDSFQRLLREENGFSATILAKDRCRMSHDFLKEFKHGLILKEREFRESRSAFWPWFNSIPKALHSPQKFKEGQEMILEALTVCRFVKSYERDLLYELGFQKAFLLADRIMEDYVFLFGMFAKMKLTGYQIESAEKALSRYEELKKLENQLLKFWENFNE